MLTAKFTANETVVLKLVTGEEVVGRFISTEGPELTLSKAFQVSMQIDPSGQPALGLLPMLMVADPMGQVTIKHEHVVIMQKPPANHPLIAEYIRATSGVHMPTVGETSTLQV